MSALDKDLEFLDERVDPLKAAEWWAGRIPAMVAFAQEIRRIGDEDECCDVMPERLLEWVFNALDVLDKEPAA